MDVLLNEAEQPDLHILRSLVDEFNPAHYPEKMTACGPAFPVLCFRFELFHANSSTRNPPCRTGVCFDMKRPLDVTLASL